MLIEREDSKYKPVRIVLETQDDFDAFGELVDAVNAAPNFQANLPGRAEEIAIELSNALGAL